MENDPPSRPASVVHRPPSRAQSTRGYRVAKRTSARPSPLPSRTSTPGTSTRSEDTPFPDAPGLEEESEGYFAPTSAEIQNITHLLDTLPPFFAPLSLPSVRSINEYSQGELIIIPLLCAIASQLGGMAPPRSNPQAPVNLGPLEASVAALTARLPPSAPGPKTFAQATASIPVALPPPPPAPADTNNAGGRKKLKNKGKKPAQEASPAQVAKETEDLTRSKGPSAIPTAARRFFAPRESPDPHPSALHIIRSFPDVAANALREAGCPYPLSLSALCNRKGSVTLLVNSPFTPASSYSPYFDLLATRLNQAYPIGDNPFLPFRLAPSETQLVIHSVPLEVLPLQKEDLQQVMAIAVRNACEATVLDSRFLQPDPELRARGTATSIVVVLAPEDVPKLGARVRIFSKSCAVNPAHSSNKYSQCRNCLRFGHVQAACKSPLPFCPLCALHHRHADHRCANLGCPKEGNLRPVPGCCLASPLHCACCGGEHAAYDRNCPARPRQSTTPPNDHMDLTSGNPTTTTPPPNAPQPVQQTPRQMFPPPRPSQETSGLFTGTPTRPPLAQPSLFTGSLSFGSSLPTTGRPRPPTPSTSRTTRSSFRRPASDDALRDALFNPVPLHPPRPPPNVDE